MRFYVLELHISYIYEVQEPEYSYIEYVKASQEYGHVKMEEWSYQNGGKIFLPELLHEDQYMEQLQIKAHCNVKGGTLLQKQRSFKKKAKHTANKFKHLNKEMNARKI